MLSAFFQLGLADRTAIETLVVATLTLVIALAALWVAAKTLGRGNRNASAATVLTLSESFREAWDRYLAAAGGGERLKKEAALGDLANLMELACGMLHERTLEGVSKDIAEDYLQATLRLFERPTLCDELVALLEKPTTFQYIRAFVSKPERASNHPKLVAGLAAAAVLQGPSKAKPGVAAVEPPAANTA